jgi:hypothetical protein
MLSSRTPERGALLQPIPSMNFEYRNKVSFFRAIIVNAG